MQEHSRRYITLGMLNGTPLVLLVRRWELSANLLHFKKLVGGGKGCQLPCCVHCRRDPRITSSSEMLEEVLVRAPRTTRCHAVGSARHSDLLFALPLALTHWICLVQDGPCDCSWP